MKYNKFYICNSEGNSNCVIRTFCKVYNKEYDNVYSELCCLSKELGSESFNDLQVFEKYMEIYNTKLFSIEDIKLRDLKLDSSCYIIFCWDKNEFYHMVPVINNIIYDYDDSCLDLFSIKIYKVF